MILRSEDNVFLFYAKTLFEHALNISNDQKLNKTVERPRYCLGLHCLQIAHFFYFCLI